MFKYDNPVFNGLNKIADCCVLSIFWLVFSLPIVTMGAATTALYFSVNRRLNNESGKLWEDFWAAFKLNFKQSTVIWLFYLAVLTAMGAGCYLCHSMAPTQPLLGIASVALVVLMNYVAVLLFLTLTYTARFIFPTRVILKNCFLISLLNLLWLPVIWLLFFLVALLLMYMPVAIVVLSAPLLWLLSRITERIFRKYMTEEDWLADLENRRTMPRGPV